MENIQKIYFLGIGGIGMSAIARYFSERGAQIFGYDRVRSSLCEELERKGMQIHYEENISLIPKDLDLVIYTPAIPATHEELQYFRREGIALKKRAEVLGIISKNQRCLAVGGTHGKTTTSAILTHLLRSGGVDCSAFLGGISLSLGANFVSGSTDIVVVEADEFDRSFLQLTPEVAIITSTDADHLDIYGTAENIEATYRQFATQTTRLIIQKQGLNLPTSATQTNYTYNTNTDKNSDKNSNTAQVVAENIRIENGFFCFDYRHDANGVFMPNLQFSQFGRHNVENATAAITAALSVGASQDGIREGLQTFGGIRRRFEFIIRTDNQVFIDDYAHHPSELKAAIEAARALYPDKKIKGIFQPHLYSRTKDFADGFAEALDLLDEIVLLDIYPARELPMAGVNSEMILERMRNRRRQLIHKEQLLAHLRDTPKAEVLLTLGAGDIGAMIGEIKALYV
jgi:UDP-N-acetylmuramate--alanine ligase